MENARGAIYGEPILEKSLLLANQDNITNPRFYEEVRFRSVRERIAGRSPGIPCWATVTLLSSMASLGPLLLWEGHSSHTDRTTFAGYILTLAITFPVLALTIICCGCLMYEKITHPSIEEMK